MTKLYAVIDTNVLVSALLRWDSLPGAVMEQALMGGIIPVLSDEIIEEYREVLARKKFCFQKEDIQTLLDGIMYRGVFFEPIEINKPFVDSKDVVFYAVAMGVKKDNDAYLVTGNTRHFPLKAFVVTPREMLTILKGKE